jgi:hypothetical protein
MKNGLSISFRQKQLYLDQDPLDPIVVQCNLDGTAEYVPGVVPVPNWVDMTEHTEGLEKFKLSWSAITGDAVESGVDERSSSGSNYQKGLSADLRFTDAAFQFIYDWLMTNPCQILNSVEVLIRDNICAKEYRIFEIKCENIDYAPTDEPCIVFMPLREGDDTIHAFQKTIIEDNWQGWFNQDGTSTKDHPTFQMIIEKKPKFFLAVNTALIYIAGMLSAGILIALNEGKRWISRCLGFTYFCPSPLIRDYIENICDKYGFTFDTIFDDDPANPYRDLCFFWPASTSMKNFEGGDYSAPSTKFIWDNRSVLPFTKFLDQLKAVFNAEWYVTPNAELIFKHVSFFDNQAPLYDFTAPGADQLHKLRYRFNGIKKPAYGDYAYIIDPQDTCSNELKWRYNDIVDFDGPANNPMLEGKVSKTFEFGSTSFHNDGSSEDFLQEGIELGRLIAIGAVLVGLGNIFLAANPITVAVVIGLLTLGYTVTNGYVNNYFNNADLNGMVRLSSSEINQPRLLLWDRTTPLDEAKVVYTGFPAVNPRYNPDAVPYYDEHPTYDGAGGVFTPGGSVERVYNYPMYVDAKYTQNLYDRFHEYDNPLVNPTINQDWEGEVDLCCDWLDRLGVWNNTFARIGAVVILEKRGTRLIKGRITNFEVDYDLGRINLKGNVLK